MLSLPSIKAAEAADISVNGALVPQESRSESNQSDGEVVTSSTSEIQIAANNTAADLPQMNEVMARRIFLAGILLLLFVWLLATKKVRRK